MLSALCDYRRFVHLEEVQTPLRSTGERAPALPVQRARSTVLAFSAFEVISSEVSLPDSRSE